MNLKKASILPIPMYYLETVKGYTGKEIVQKAGNESTRYKRAPLRFIADVRCVFIVGDNPLSIYSVLHSPLRRLNWLKIVLQKLSRKF
jgi:hypothetical protein